MTDIDIRADRPVGGRPDGRAAELGQEGSSPMAGSRRAAIGRWAAVGVAGVALVVVGTMALPDVTQVVRVGMALAGIALVYTSMDRLGRLAFGEEFDVALWLSVVWLAVLSFAAITVDLLPLAESRDVSKTLTTPTLLRPDLFSEHPLGTDRQGLDILGGVIYGARVSLVVSIGAVLVGTTVGGVIGIAAGFFRGRLDAVVGIVSDSMLAFPPLILLLAMVAVLEPNVVNVTIALALLGIPSYIRLSRANTLAFAQREFVLCARAMGATRRRLMFRELLPNVALPVMSYGFIVAGALIVAEASLSFLGLSIQRPNPTWGNMIAAGEADFARHPHLVFTPGVVLFITVYSLNRVGDRVRALWDPRQSAL